MPVRVTASDVRAARAPDSAPDSASDSASGTGMRDDDLGLLADYVGLTDVALRRRTEPERGLYIAESEKVIRRALAAGHRPRSLLMAERWLTDLADVVAAAERDGVPVFVGEYEVMEELTGFHLHRGALASMHRPAAADRGSPSSPMRGGCSSSRTSSTTPTWVRRSGAGPLWGSMRSS